MAWNHAGEHANNQHGHKDMEGSLRQDVVKGAVSETARWRSFMFAIGQASRQADGPLMPVVRSSDGLARRHFNTRRALVGLYTFGQQQLEPSGFSIWGYNIAGEHLVWGP